MRNLYSSKERKEFFFMHVKYRKLVQPIGEIYIGHIIKCPLMVKWKFRDRLQRALLRIPPVGRSRIQDIITAMMFKMANHIKKARVLRCLPTSSQNKLSMFVNKLKNHCSTKTIKRNTLDC